MSDVSNFRLMFLPYCLLLQADGSYVVCNRRYKPVGNTRTDFVEYEGLHAKARFARKLSTAQIAFLDCLGRTDPERIFLYNDGCIPTSSAAAWAAYSLRLQRLAGYDMTPANE